MKVLDSNVHPPPLYFYLQSWSSVWFDIFIFSFVTISSVTLSRKHSKMLYKISYRGFQIMKFRTPNFRRIKRDAPPTMVISLDFWMRRYSEDDHREDTPRFSELSPRRPGRDWQHWDSRFTNDTGNTETPPFCTNNIDTLRPFLGASVFSVQDGVKVSQALRVQAVEKVPQHYESDHCRVPDTSNRARVWS